MASLSSREIEKLAIRLEPAIRRAFVQALIEVQRQAPLDLVADLLRAGQVDTVLEALGLDAARFSPLSEAIRQAFVAGADAGLIEMPPLRLSLDPIITGRYRPRSASPTLRPSFDLRNPAAEGWLRDNSSKLITGIIEDQRTLVRGALQQGMAVGRNPRQTALDLVGRVGESGRRAGGLVGLTAQQGQFVANVRTQLASGDPNQMAAYFGRKRRDKRLDGIVKRAIAAGKPVSQADIEKIAGCYADRLLALRGEMVARTESITAMNAGREESYRQQVEAGKLAPENVTCTWSATGDRQTRHSHAAMNGQRRRFGEPFVTPSGAQMNYPGDSSLGAGAEETIGCRCMKQYRIDMTAEVLRGQQVR
ncbi:phage minor head protein [Stenotrophomonas sp. CFBP 13718]|uniref:phage minor head protein n=1 Tax=Stenotrophomonas sp. CFBP 13718 TaxID=2775304 RepID=UPI0017841E98|nr:phage minor head protein [Stenotrophomonas sp. CFBP 13718]MBD8696597.1 head morphogenesis protein [Stenotrophomonas sp. CFBP 13718]